MDSPEAKVLACFLKDKKLGLLGSPVIKALPSNAGGVGSIPGQRAKIPHACGQENQNIKQKQ